jgi:hypothetical protein
VWIRVAEVDPMRGEGIAFAGKLIDAGVKVGGERVW